MKQIEQELKKVLDRMEVSIKNNISLNAIEQQLKLFVNGVKIPKIAKPCTIGDGIVELKKDDHDDLLNSFDTASSNGRLIKFVPASGAASRMFQKLQSVLNRFNNFTLDDLKKYSESDSECKSVLEFLINLPNFAFYDDLKAALKVDDLSIEKLINNSPAEILKAVLFENGLNYSSKPKGALKFHRYKDEYRTAFEEHVYEAFQYIPDNDGNTKIHFTISEEHTEFLNKIVNELKSKLANKYILDITYSYQKKSTDTIAVDLENKLIFNKSGNLVHRPGGHGALLENLNDLKADFAVIKNIDNVSNEGFASDTIFYKKLLIGYLVKIQKQIFGLLHLLEKKNISNYSFNEIIEFVEKQLFVIKPTEFENWSDEQKNKFLFAKLNRPIRVCGMVKNVGEPGGGPFWVCDNDGSLSLQIIEQAQINTNDENQKNIFKQSTHFNPVDLVCGLKDYKGNNFNLQDFVDHKAGIITNKSKDGVELKALELPGLWNGSMADWITVFIEVPISTFNPVKEVNDLLRKEHQG